VVHGFIVDFCCTAERLVLELEGAPHAGSERRAYDAARAATLEAAGYRVIRVANRDVTRDHLAALLSRALEDRLSSPLSAFAERGTGGEDRSAGTGGED
jgi:very-short-patch-repair endonuclease